MTLPATLIVLVGGLGSDGDKSLREQAAWKEVRRQKKPRGKASQGAPVALCGPRFKLLQKANIEEGWVDVCVEADGGGGHSFLKITCLCSPSWPQTCSSL